MEKNIKNKSVLIVGTGLGGLTTALRLAKRGYRVEMIEKNEQAGGRLNQLKKDGFTFDSGPSFFSMSYEFKEFATDCGIEIPFKFVELDPLYTVNFSGSNKTFYLYKDLDKLAAQFAQEEPDFKAKMTRYLKKSGALYNDTVDKVIKTNFDNVIAYVISLAQVNPVHIPQLFQTFWQHVQKYFDSKEAQQIVSLIAFFLGRTPFDTSAIYALLSHIEFVNDGYYNVEGGMYKIVEGLVSELHKADVKMSYNVEIVDVESKGNKVTAVIDSTGKTWTADAILINADAAVFRGRVLKREKYSEPKLLKMNWTMGYLTFYIGIKRKLPMVNHHNYYLGTNFADYSHRLEKDPDTLEKPYYYVNVLSKHNANCAPEGCETLFFVCPVPNMIYKPDWSDRDKIVDSILDDFGKRIGVDIMPEIVSRTIYTPAEWEKRFNLFKGSGLGLSHNLGQIGAFRPANIDEKFKNLFYVGASTVPGAGLPMAVISSKLATERITNYLK
ncbi:MAG: phytoene desaturase [Porphyromonadaceae bacterium CG2_30_38_12]|nr:MAG: phytoene desaturase [Porphyromonadaceae bacterium CG2_30_38_12]